MDVDAKGSKQLILLGMGPDSDKIAQADARLAPRLDFVEIARALKAEIISFRTAASRRSPFFNHIFARDPLLGSSIEAFARRSDFQSIYLTGEDVGFRIVPLLRLAGWSGRIVMRVHNCYTKKNKLAFKAVGQKLFAKLICTSKEQQNLLVSKLGFPPEKVKFLHKWVDTDFFCSDHVENLLPKRDYVFSCGLENRDYITLKKAALSLPYKFDIVASGFFGRFGPITNLAAPNIVVHETRLSYSDLRRLYAGARFVIVPLNAAPYGAGVTGLVEAMAMGKAVVVTASPGIAGYVMHGVSGLLVPPSDPRALARAVEELWNAPEQCEAMGRRNRAWAEINASTEIYVRQIAKLMNDLSAD